MKKNIGISDRVIRFIASDLLLGFSISGMTIPPELLFIATLLVVNLWITILFGYSLFYQIIGMDTKAVSCDEVATA